MDQEFTQFRAGATMEDQGRDRMGRPYSAALRDQAVRYWAQRQRAGTDLAGVAATLGIAPWSLQRWAQTPQFATVQVVPQTAPRVVSTLVVVLTTDSVRNDQVVRDSGSASVAARRITGLP